MSQLEFADAALVLLGHGNTLDPDSSASVYQHAAELRGRGCFAEVREAFWKQSPQLSEVLSDVRRPRVFILPLFISEGHFSEHVIPRALGFRTEEAAESGRVRRSAHSALVYCRPIGTHPAMVDVLSERTREVLEKFPFPRPPRARDVTLFIAGHGTEQNARSREVVDDQAAALGARNIYAAVHAVFLDEEPRIPACYQMAQTRYIVVVPFFISEGLHVRQDIPVLLGEPEQLVQKRIQSGQAPWRNPTEKHGKLVWYARSAGSNTKVVEVILERVREGARWLSAASSRDA